MNSESPVVEPSQLLLALRRSTLFASLSAEAMAALEAQLTPVTLMSGELLFKEGDPSDNVFIVISGRLRVVSAAADDQSERVLADPSDASTIRSQVTVSPDPPH